jgi:hypothetical protein
VSNAVYEKRGTPIVWTNTGGDKLLNAKALAVSTGRLGAFLDRGANAAPAEYEMRVYTAWVADPAVTDLLKFAVVESDGTHQDAGVGYHADNDAAISAAAFNTLRSGLGAVSAHTADANEKGTSRIVRLSSLYVAVAVFNTSTTKTLADVDGATAIVLTPLYYVVQPAP